MLTPVLISFKKDGIPNRAAFRTVLRWTLVLKSFNCRCAKWRCLLKTVRLVKGEKIVAKAAPSIFKFNPKIKSQSMNITKAVCVKAARIVSEGLPSFLTKLIVT